MPEPEVLKRRCVALAVLDLVNDPDGELPYFAFKPAWRTDAQLASMNNYTGDEYSIVFSARGTFIRGFDHESGLSPWAFHPPQVPPGLIQGVPDAFRIDLNETAWTLDGIPMLSVVLWRQPDDQRWSFGEPSDPELLGTQGGAEWLFDELDGEPATYARFASEYWERDLNEVDIARVFAHEPLTAALVARLNPGADANTVIAKATAIGYPLGD
jgi:hypothetical protein